MAVNVTISVALNELANVILVLLILARNVKTPLGWLSGGALITNVVSLILPTTVCPLVNPVPTIKDPTCMPNVLVTTKVVTLLPVGL